MSWNLRACLLLTDGQHSSSGSKGRRPDPAGILPSPNDLFATAQHACHTSFVTENPSRMPQCPSKCCIVSLPSQRTHGVTL
ncbi:hypothetical protein HYQ46_001398 [Verticillium longisporum]|nr:hypothetical protein HYQ46_001398 [Verticillium longisporum]